MLIPWEIWRDHLVQDAPESVARSVWEQLSPEPNQVNLDKLDLKRYYSLAIPKSFIYCRQDKAMGAGYFHPGMSSRLGSFKLLEMSVTAFHRVLTQRGVDLRFGRQLFTRCGHSGWLTSARRRDSSCYRADRLARV
jgi:hypothetical protein